MSHARSAAEVYTEIASGGNSENKAALLAAMVPYEPYTVTEIFDLHLGIQDDNPAWKMAINGPFNYAQTFADVGQLTEATVGHNGALAYQKIRRGVDAVPMIGHLLHLSLTETPPLLAYAGPTNTSSGESMRPNQRRIEIMRLLIANDGDPIRLSDIAGALGIQIHHAFTIGDTMKSYGLVEKTSTGRGRPSVKYMGTPDLLTMNIRTEISSQFFLDATDTITAMYLEKPEAAFTNEDVAVRLIKTKYSDVPLTQMIKQVAQITSRFAKLREVLISTREVSSADIARETVYADATQLKLLNRYVEIVDGAVTASDAYTKNGQDWADEILAKKTSVNKLIAKARRYSTGNKSTYDSQQDVIASICQILTTAEEPLTAGAVRNRLEKVGIILSKRAVFSHIGVLLENGVVSAKEHRSGYLYEYVGQTADD